jgi:hypothetical protein
MGSYHTPDRLPRSLVLADWYVYQHDGDYLGPWPTETVAGAILSGKLGSDVWVAAPGGQRWLRAVDVPVISRLVEGVPSRPRRRDSGLRLVPHVLAMQSQAREDSDSAAQTLKMPTMRFRDDDATPTPPSPRFIGGRRRRTGN